MNLDAVSRHDATAVTDERRESAVVAPVIERDDRPHLLFIKRSEDLSNHAGQMSFPGGRREPEDLDLQATAIREVDEEIGMRREELSFVGRLDDIRTVTNFSIRPFVARAPDRTYVPDDIEVAEVAILSVADLTDLENYHSEQRDHPHYGQIRLHYFYVGGYTVWGATARILTQLLELTTDWSPPPEVDAEVDPDADYPV